ncbi:MAG: hypothetical protein ABR499_05270 [Gemmatimonadaceae bacterium]
MAEKRIHEVDHELPCGHTLRTSELLEAVERFAPAVSRGYLDCPVCGETSYLEFAAAAASDGREEFTETYVSTGTLQGDPREGLTIHQRRRVPGLTVEWQIARWGGREWVLRTR